MSQRLNYHKAQGFTLIEILVVIGIIALLAGIVLIAINPARQFAQARNTQRSSDLNALLSAIGQRLAENKGLFNCSAVIPTITTVPNPLVAGTGVKIGSNQGNLDIRSCLVPTYISELPVDPSVGMPYNQGSYDTGYYIFQDQNSRITLYAPTLEPTVGNTMLSLTR